MNETGQVDRAEHLQFPGVAPGRLINLLERAPRNVAGIVDEDIDAGSFVRQPMKSVRFAKVDSMRNDVDLIAARKRSANACIVSERDCPISAVVSCCLWSYLVQLGGLRTTDLLIHSRECELRRPEPEQHTKERLAFFATEIATE